MPRPHSFLPLAAGACLLWLTGGCTLFRNMGTGQRMEPGHEVQHRPTNRGTRTMQVETTTDAAGNVVNLVFRRSSGSQAVDDFVAESIRSTSGAAPSTRSLVELTYSAEKGFSPPKLLSSSPAP